MKKSVLQLGVLSIMLIGIVSCANKEKEEADKIIGELEIYIDSVSSLSAVDRQTNWDKISADYQTKNTSANEVLLNTEGNDKAIYQAKVDASNSKYDQIKVTIITSNDLESNNEDSKNISSSQLLRDRLFGAGKIGSDMSFDWVNMLPAISLGLFSAAVLNINNIRDIASDTQAGKKSIPVRIGRNAAITYNWSLILGGNLGIIFFALLESSWWAISPLLILPLMIKVGFGVSKGKNSSMIDPFLKKMAISTLLWVIAFGLGWIIFN